MENKNENTSEEIRHFTFITQVYSHKNKLEKAVADFLIKHKRRIISHADLPAFKRSIKNGIEKINAENSRCKPVKSEWWSPSQNGKGEDWSLSFGGTQICHFVIYYELVTSTSSVTGKEVLA